MYVYIFMMCKNGTAIQAACERILLSRCFFEVIGKDLKEVAVDDSVLVNLEDEMNSRRICPLGGILS